MSGLARRVAPGLVVAFAYLLLDDFALIHMGRYQLGRVDVDSPFFNASAFVATYLVSLLTLAVFHVHDRAWLRLPAQLVAIVSISTYFGFASTNDRGFTTSEANLLWSEIEYVPSALGFFLRDYAPALFATVGAVVALEWWLRRHPTGVRTRWVLCLPVLAVAMCLQMLSRTDSKVEQFPLAARIPALTIYAYFHQSIYTGAREPVPFSPDEEPIADHIVLIVDESIRGDLLSLNGFALPTTPWLEGISDRLFNYGTATAAANLSAPANIILQSGLRPDQLPDTELRSLKNPNVFSFLERAGYWTTLVNAQNVLARPPNFMSEADVAEIDEYVQLRNRAPETKEHLVDYALPGLLEGIFEAHERSFTYVIKNGAHFPYRGKFAEEGAPFAPDLWLGSHDESQAKVLSNYMNTLHWTVDNFLRELVTALEGRADGVLIVYTADHAQSLFEPRPDGRDPIRGHGQHDAPPEEQSRVPLLLLPLDAALRARLEPLYVASLRDRTSAFELFSTLLRLGGYSAGQLAGRYVPSIFDADADRSRRVFVSGNHFGADGPLYRDAPYRSSFQLNVVEAPPR